MEPLRTQGLSVHPSVRPRVLLRSTLAFLKPGVSFYVTKLGFFLPEFLQAGDFIPNQSREINPGAGGLLEAGGTERCWPPPQDQSVFPGCL